MRDYRDEYEQFDHIVSIGMFEHVGYKNYRAYMEMARRCLKPGGLFLLHTIGSNISDTYGDPWIEKYIFRAAWIPSAAQIGESMEGLFVMEDWHNFGPYYDLTLMEWNRRFQEAWPDLREKYGERFRAHVGVLPPLLRRHLPRALDAALADRALAWRHAGRV